MRIFEMQAASVAMTAKLFSIPYRHVRRAVANGELGLFGSGEGRTALPIFEDVRAWRRSRPPEQYKAAYDRCRPMGARAIERCGLRKLGLFCQAVWSPHFLPCTWNDFR